MKYNVSKFKQCANCGACVNICPVNAIRVCSDALFYRVTVNEEICVFCGRCIAVCPVENPVPDTNICGAWWGKCKDKKEIRMSSSGGAFAAIAKHVLANNGVVFGACYDTDFTVRIRSTNDVPLDDLRKSKYAESLTDDSFRKAEEQLQSGKMVLFCGTPCQIAGLKNYLGKEYDRLYTCDFTCGGISSHVLFQMHLASLEEKYKSKVVKVDFRPKVYGWSTNAIRVDFANGKKYIQSGSIDPFFCGFSLKHVNARAYCYDCKFAEQHVADIILADFWHYEQITGRRRPEDGISLILANSSKGRTLFCEASHNMELHALDIDTASYNLKKREYSEAYMNMRREYLDCCKALGLEEAGKIIKKPYGLRAVYIKMRHFLKGVAYKIR